MQDLEASCARLAAIQQQVSWPGGLTNHPDAFGPLCRMLLAAHVALLLAGAEGSAAGAPCAAVECLRRCSRLLADAPLHPLLANMLYQVCSRTLTED